MGGDTATAQVLITTKDIKDGTIKSADVRDRAIRHHDIKKSTITRDRLAKKVRQLLDEQGEACRPNRGRSKPSARCCIPGGKQERGNSLERQPCPLRGS